LIQRRLLDMHGFQVLWLHELLRAAVNTVVAIPIFLLLDHTKIQE
jgi:rod shape-determining protein MreD